MIMLIREFICFQGKFLVFHTLWEPKYGVIDFLVKNSDKPMQKRGDGPRHRKATPGLFLDTIKISFTYQ